MGGERVCKKKVQSEVRKEGKRSKMDGKRVESDGKRAPAGGRQEGETEFEFGRREGV